MDALAIVPQDAPLQLWSVDSSRRNQESKESVKETHLTRLTTFPCRVTGLAWGPALEDAARGPWSLALLPPSSPTQQQQDSVSLWDPSTATQVSRMPSLDKHGNPVACRFMSRGRALLLGYPSGLLKVWDRKEGKYREFSKGPRETVPNPQGHALLLSMNADETVIAWAFHREPRILLYNRVHGTQTAVDLPKGQTVSSLEFSLFKKQFLAVGTEQGSVYFVDIHASSNPIVATLSNVHSAAVSAIAFSPFNRFLLVSVSVDKRLVLYDAEKQKAVRTMETEVPLTCVSFKGDGVTLALGTITGSVLIYDLSSKTKIPVCQADICPGIPIQSLKFMPPSLCSGIKHTSMAQMVQAAQAKADPGDSQSQTVPTSQEPSPNDPKLAANQSVNFMEMFSPVVTKTRTSGLSLSGQAGQKRLVPRSLTAELSKLSTVRDEEPVKSEPRHQVTPPTVPLSDPVSSAGSSSVPVTPTPSVPRSSTTADADTKSIKVSSTLPKPKPHTDTSSLSLAQTKLKMTTATPLDLSINGHASALAVNDHEDEMLAAARTSVILGDAAPFQSRLDQTVEKLQTSLKEGVLSSVAALTPGNTAPEQTRTASHEHKPSLPDYSKPTDSDHTRSLSTAPPPPSLAPSAPMNVTDTDFATRVLATVIDESLATFRQDIHRDLHHLHVDLLRQFEQQKAELASVMAGSMRALWEGMQRQFGVGELGGVGGFSSLDAWSSQMGMMPSPPYGGGYGLEGREQQGTGMDDATRPPTNKR